MIDFYVSIGSVSSFIASQMVMAFGLHQCLHTQVHAMHANEKHLAGLVLALSSSNRTCILDEPFTGLSYDQSIKLVKIIRQKYNCTIIITASSKAQL